MKSGGIAIQIIAGCVNITVVKVLLGQCLQPFFHSVNQVDNRLATIRSPNWIGQPHC